MKHAIRRAVRRRRTRRFAAWLAMLAMALDVLWPLLAHARPGAPVDLLEMACSTGGAKQFPAPVGAPEGPQDGQQLLPHCAYCTAGAGKAALTANFATLCVEGRPGAPVAASSGTRPRHAARFADARPRAPPVHS